MAKPSVPTPGALYALSQTVALPAPLAAGLWSFTLTLELPAPRKGRRIELELNGSARNLCHLQAFYLRPGKAAAVVRFAGQIDVQPADLPLTVSALPGKLMEEGLGAADHDKYAAIPFVIRSADLRWHGKSSDAAQR